MTTPSEPWPYGCHPDPIEQFRAWFRDAEGQGGGADPHEMALATATPEGFPSVRMVLLKSYDERGFVFYTNYESRKAQELEANPRAALLFWWRALDRQVRVEGTVARVDSAQSDAYFRTRPRESQISAWASPQSRVIPHRDDLERLFAETERKYEGRDVPRPPFWGGFRLTPHVIEFWIGGAARRHHRLRYRRDDASAGEQPRWIVEQLAP